MSKAAQSLLLRRQQLGDGAANTPGLTPPLFQDTSGQFPKSDAVGQPGASVITRGSPVQLKTFGASFPDDIVLSYSTEAGKVYLLESPRGNVVHLNDTPGNETVIIKHRTGAGVQINPDGTVVCTGARKAEVVSGTYTLEVGEGTLTFHGDLNLTVNGDFNVNVTGDYNLNAKKETKNIETLSQTTVEDLTLDVTGSVANTVNGTVSDTILGEYHLNVKQDMSLATEKGIVIASMSGAAITDNTQVNISSNDINIVAPNMSVLGDVGTIGGQDMHLYCRNLRANKSVFATDTVTTKTVRATTSVETDTIRASASIRSVAMHCSTLNASASVETDTVRATSRIETDTLTTNVARATLFYGDLNGIAAVARSQSYGETATSGGAAIATVADSSEAANAILADSASAITENTTETAEANETSIAGYLTNDARGIKIVEIDPNNGIKNALDKSFDTGGISKKEVTLAKFRQKAREPNNLANNRFASNALSSGNVSPDAFKTTPPNIVAAVSLANLSVYGQTPLGNISAGKVVKKVKA